MTRLRNLRQRQNSVMADFRFPKGRLKVDGSISARRLRQPAGVMLRQLEEQSVLLNLDTGNFYGLDDVGTRLYVLLVSSPNLEAAFEAALREYDVAPGTLHDDMVALVTRLVEEGLLEVHDDRPTP